MAGYLDKYGAGEEQRNRLILRTVGAVVLVVVVGALSWYLFKNHHQEGVVKQFLAALRRSDYQSAYRAWGCTPEKPCPVYAFDKFMDDWGPKSSAPDPAVLGIADSESCNSGVLLTVQVNRSREEKLWVDKTADNLSFAPYPVCPHKSPFAIMMHRTVGQLRKPLLK